MNLLPTLIQLRRFRAAREILALYGIEFPASVVVGSELRILHRGFGTVLHPSTVIGDRVQIYHQVTVGRKDAHVAWEESAMERVVLDDDCVIFPGAKILGGAGETRIGKRTIVAANSVVLTSTGDDEVWAGAPARKVSTRVS